ncbi:MAG: rane protein, partial [Akkermansiaceae bacterium]|nr:rane protein [Akkermansiaceae bacterium]
AVFQFTQGLESGMNRMVWGPDGSLYVGGLGAGGNWNWKNTTSGLQRLRPNGKLTFEMKSVRARGDGLIVEFTQPVPYATAVAAESYALQQYRYVPEPTYGGPKYNQETLSPERIDLSSDRRKVFLKIPGLKTDRVVALRLKNFVNDLNTAPWATEAWYTLNQQPDEMGPDFEVLTEIPEPVQPVAPEKTLIYEAEDATLRGPVKTTEHPGYSGSGYADYGSAVGESITWSVPVVHAGTQRLVFRYANGGTDNRPLAIRVNGTVVATPLFGPTGGWPAWMNTASVDAVLNKGANTISLTSTTATGPNVDHLEVTGPPPPPPGAVVLFDGTPNSLANFWKRDADGGLPNWAVSGGAMRVGLSPAPNDLITRSGFKDFKLHLEWLSPAGGVGQLGGNSGVKLQRSYEIQVLNTAKGTAPGLDTAGAIYLQTAAAKDASLGAGAWQSYDIDFTAARWSGTTKVANARASVRWNGMLVQDDVAITGPTGAPVAEAPGLQPLLLQAHASDASGPVQFRNIWVMPKDSFAAQFDSWLSEMGVTGDDHAPLADPDGDGMNNLWEYACGANPRVSERQAAGGESLAPQMAQVEENGTHYIEFTFVRRADAAARGLFFTIETSPTLAADSWTRRPATQTAPPVPLGDGGTERVTLRVDAPVAAEPQLFARIRAEILD